MKQSYLLLAGFIAVFLGIIGTGCTMLDSSGEAGIPGKYTRQMPSKSAIVFDTITIQVVSASAHQYLVEQRMVQKEKQGKKWVIISRSADKYAAYYNADKNLLEIPELMTYVGFEEGAIVTGNFKYKKLE